MQVNRRTTILRVVALVFVIGLSVGVYLMRDRVRDLEEFGYAGVFLISLVSSATIILPVPGVLVTSMMGAVFNPFWVAIAAGIGAALGELSGYLAGFSGQGVAQKAEIYQKLENWMRRFGPVTVLVLGFIPNPLFDMAGMVAGALKMPLWKFLLFCTIGKIGKMMLFAYGGDTVMGWFN
jgi:membrane protein YqaA with SNARE-associated domain